MTRAFDRKKLPAARLLFYGVSFAAVIASCAVLWALTRPADVTVLVVLSLETGQRAEKALETIETLSVMSRTYDLSFDARVAEIVFRGIVDERRLHDLRFSLAAIEGVRSASITTAGR